MVLFERLGNYKFGFSELEDALAFYAELDLQDTFFLPVSTHIIKGQVWEEIPELHFVNVISTEDKDSEADFLSKLAFNYESFVDSGCKDHKKEFDYLPGYKIIEQRDPKFLRRFHYQT